MFPSLRLPPFAITFDSRRIAGHHHQGRSRTLAFRAAGIYLVTDPTLRHLLGRRLLSLRTAALDIAQAFEDADFTVLPRTAPPPTGP